MWLDPESDSFLELQNVVFDQTLLKDLFHLTHFPHTGILEVYHSLYNKLVPKSTHFSYYGMMTRSMLAVMDLILVLTSSRQQLLMGVRDIISVFQK